MSTYNHNFKSLLGGYFLSHGFDDYKNGWLKGKYFNCPFCGRENKFGVNISTNWYHCFRCDAKGDLVNLIYTIEKLDTFNEVVSLLKKYEELGYKVKETRAELKELKPLILPEGFRLLSQGDSQLAKSARSYIKNRGFDITKASRLGWGYSTDKNHYGYIILPYYQDHQIVYYNARNFMNPTGPRYLNPELEEGSLGKSQLLYNEEALYTYNSVFLCEGIFNAVSISYDRGICTAGKFVSDYQLNKILKSPVERIILCLDRDALEQSIQLAFKLIDYKRVKLIQFPENKDANDLGLRKSLGLIYRNRYLSYKQLIQLKNEV